MQNKAILLVLLSLPMLAVASEQEHLPKDVATFVEKRDLCDHFRGEEPFDEDRRKFLFKNMRELCTGTDRRLSELKSKYQSNSSVMKKLSTYEVNIELGE